MSTTTFSFYFSFFLCVGKNFRPEPDKFVSKSRYDNMTGLYSTTTYATVRTNLTNFVCHLSINGTGYHRSTNNSASGKYILCVAIPSPKRNVHKKNQKKKKIYRFCSNEHIPIHFLFLHTDSDSLSDASSGNIIAIAQITLLPMFFYMGLHIFH